jgi:pimeloyl-ACP methyl ester carboxylesterase
MKLKEFQEHSATVETHSGPVAYASFGRGRTALFLHGVGTNGFLWRHAIDGLRDERRCVAIDLPLHGRTPSTPGQDFTLNGLAHVVEDFCEALGLDQIDLVANDTGGAIAQTFAARHPDRLRTLTLTNCDTRPNIPPEDFRPVVDAAAAGAISELVAAAGPIEVARGGLQPSYEHPIEEETLHCFADPVFGTPERTREFERFLVAALRPDDLAEVEPLLRTLTVPTLLAWGTADPFFPLSDAEWLRELIPGVTDLVEIEGGLLFFADERATELLPHLRNLWKAH